MAEDSDLEQTEPASARRLEQARADGDVPRSRELATCTLLLAAGAGLWFMGGSLVGHISSMLVSSFTFERAHAFDSNLLMTRLAASLGDVMLSFAPLAGLLMLAALASPLLIGGWLFSAKALQPNFGRMNPLKGLGNMISARAAADLGKAVGKAILVGTVAWMVISSQIDTVLGLSLEPLVSGSVHLGGLLLVSFVSIVSALVFIALIDAPYQMWQYANKLKMTKQDVRQEAKESDGNPDIKAKIRAQQREMARRRMMSEIPGADVVITNPTHYAVALKYADGAMGAPKVVAKGADAVAARIREIAAVSQVPTLEAPALARALYRHAELGDEIPQALYSAVAEVLAYVFQLRTFARQGGVRPEALDAVAVPPELDPLNRTAQAASSVGPMP
jgi:flagellar biosynthetic protein FlhB